MKNTNKKQNENKEKFYFSVKKENYKHLKGYKRIATKEKEKDIYFVASNNLKDNTEYIISIL